MKIPHHILTNVPNLPHVQLENAKAILALAEQFGNEERSSTFKAATDDPKHPGWPAGTPDSKGGQFRPKDDAVDGGVNIAADRNTYQRCLDECYPLLERFQPAGADFNRYDFLRCMNACMASSS